MAITFTITNAGRNALVNAANTGTATVTIVQAGLSGTALAPSPAMTALPGEFKRIGTLSGDVVADDTIHIIVRDESSDVFTLRSIALYLADGTLFGIYGQSDPVLEKSSQALMLLAVDIRFEDVAANAISFGNANFLNPPATTERQGVVELATVPEAKAGADPVRAVTPAAAKQSVNDWIGYVPVNRAGDTMTGQLSVQGLVNNEARTYLRPEPNGWHWLAAAGLPSEPGSLVLGFRAAGNSVAEANFMIGGTVKFQLTGAGALIGGNTVWHAGNDGAGSGLDADMLDGQDSAYFTNIPARLGYQPANKAGDTFSGAIRRDGNFALDYFGSADEPAVQFNGTSSYFSFNRAAKQYYAVIDGGVRFMISSTGTFVGGNKVWHAGNDGAGSGLDADLLDGLDSAFYANIPARLGYTPVNKAGDTVDGRLTMGGLVNNDARTYLRPASDGWHWLAAAGLPSEPGSLAFGFHSDASSVTEMTFMIGGAVKWQLNSGGALIGGNTVWHAGNDGAGSGLDADMLDGQDSSYYSNIPARLGYQPANKAGDIFSGAIRRDAGFGLDYFGDANEPAVQFDGGSSYFSFGRAAKQYYAVIDGAVRFTISTAGAYVSGNSVWHAGNDGAGSGLDADLLDGQDGGYYSDITARLGYSPVNKAGDTVDGQLHVGGLTNNASRTYLRPEAGGWHWLAAAGLPSEPGSLAFGFTTDGSSVSEMSFMIGGAAKWQLNIGGARIDGNTVWHAGNDGAGSGLDADMLDGQDSGYYSDVPARLGYQPANRAGDIFSGPIRRDAGFGLDYFGDANEPAVQFDGGSSYFSFGRAAKQYYAVIDGGVRFTISATGAFIAGNSVWHGGNDGAGSGLDADLLDGQDGSYYSNIPARLGYQPANKAGDIFSGAIKRDNNFGLDYFFSADQPAVQFDGGSSYFSFGRTAKQYYAVIDGGVRFTISSAGASISGNAVWHGGNDGAGSGLDADLLDGQDGGYYANIPARLGYQPANKAGDAFTGTITAPEIILTANGTGQAVRVGDDAWIGDANIVDGIRIAGINSPHRGYISFGNSDATALGREGGGHLTYGGNRVWHAGNDGAASGLDADLLDGQDGSFYSDIPARLGYAPVNKAGDTIVGQLAVGGLVNNGARTYLRPEASGWHWIAAAGLPSEPGSLAFGFANDGNSVTEMTFMIGGAPKWQLNSGGAFIGGGTVWHAGNDGAGSGLDADLLDGLQADAFNRVVAQNMAAIDGYRVYADGTKECWTRLSIGQHQYATWNLPVAHESFVHPSLGCSTAGGNTEVQDNTGITSINGVESITFWNADDRTITVWVRTIGR